MPILVKDANGNNVTVATADDIVAALNANATATSVKGSPTTTMLTVQPGNDYSDLGAVTQAFNGSGPLFGITKSQGQQFQTLVLSVEAVATGASVTVRARQATTEAWANLRLQQAGSAATTGTAIVGQLYHVFIPYKFVEVLQSGGTVGSTIAYAELYATPPSVREVLSFTSVARASNLLQSNGNITTTTSTLHGAALTKPYAIPESDWSSAAPTGGVTAVSDVILVAATVGLRNYVTALDVVNTHMTLATEVVVKDGASTVVWRRKLNPGAAASVTFNSPLRGTVNTSITFACSVAAEVYVNAQGYVAP